MKAINALSIIGLILLFIIVTSCLFVIKEGEHAIVLRLGKIQYNADNQVDVKMPGLHYKWPFIERVRLFDVRLQTFEPRPSRIVTGEQKDVLVDYFVKWKITDPGLYYKRTSGDPRKAEQLVNQQVNDKLRAEFGQRTIKDVVSEDRTLIMQSLNSLVNENAKIFGIKVVDVRIKRIDLPDEVRNGVYERMRSTRKVVAARHRETGKADAEAISAQADAQAAVKVATAQKKAADMRAEGDAKAAKIYADAYNQDADFYEFYRSINAYENVFSNRKDILVLRPDSQFFQYFTSMGGGDGHMQYERVK